jgi:hypothetical protein
LLPGNNPPGYITGILSTPAVYPDYACIDLTFINAQAPECNCNYRWCRMLPKCPFGALNCEFGLEHGEIFCIGFDQSGNPVYQFQVILNNPNAIYATWISQGLTLSGFPSYVPSGINAYTVTVTAPQGSTQFCIILSAYDLVTHRICTRKFCIYDLPGCEVPTRSVIPVKPISGAENTIQPWLQLKPNPASGEVTVYYLMPSAGMLTVLTPDGKEMSRTLLENPSGELRLNLMDYQQGMYLVCLKPVSGRALFSKLAVIR